MNWSGLGLTSIFPTLCASILWTGYAWVAGGGSEIISIVASSSVLAYSYDGIYWTTVSSPITSVVTGLACNNEKIIAIGSSLTGSGNTIAYSNDLIGSQWTGLETSILNNTNISNFPNVKWIGHKFVAFGTDTINRIVYSSDGINWNSSATSQTVFTDSALSGDCATESPNIIYFPNNVLITGNLLSQDNGLSWKNFTDKTNIQSIGYNGSQWIFGGEAGSHSYISYDLSGGNFITLPFVESDPYGINVIKWNGKQWMLGSNSPTTKQLLTSYDGFNWLDTNTSSFTSPGYPCNGIAWNGSIWIASGLTSSGSSYIIYSNNGFQWHQGSNILGGGPVEWNGSYFLCAGPFISETPNITFISKSVDGLNWTQFIIGSYGFVHGISWNGNVWVLTTNASGSVEGILTSDDSVNWQAVGDVQSYSHLGVVWNGLSFVINTTTSIIRYSYDAIYWNNVSIDAQNGSNLLWTQSNIGKMTIQQPTIVGGSGTNSSMIYSLDGIRYKNIGNGIFTDCRAVCWNGSLWLAGGIGINTLAYSYDGLSWSGLGSDIFNGGCLCLAWNGTTWVAGGYGGNTIATSIDGKTWIQHGSSIFDVNVLSVDWNGSTWLMTGSGYQNTLAYSNNSDGSQWTGLGTSLIIGSCLKVKWMINKWFIGGSSGIYYAMNDLTIWNLAFNGGSYNALYWNGSIAIAGGSGANTIATSVDGITWTGLGNSIITTNCNDLFWNTRRWIAVGNNGVFYSYDGTIWYNAINNGILSNAYCIGSNSKIGATVVNSGLYLNTNDKLVVNTPKYYDQSLSSDTAISMNMNLPA